MLSASEALKKSLEVDLNKIDDLIVAETKEGNMSLSLKELLDSTVLCSHALSSELSSAGYNVYVDDNDSIYKISWEDADSKKIGEIID